MNNKNKTTLTNILGFIFIDLIFILANNIIDLIHIDKIIKMDAITSIEIHGVKIV